MANCPHKHSLRDDSNRHPMQHVPFADYSSPNQAAMLCQITDTVRNLVLNHLCIVLWQATAHNQAPWQASDLRVFTVLLAPGTHLV